MNEEAIKEEKPSIGQTIKSFLMKTTNGMAIGLFGTLIIGVIINLLSSIPGCGVIGDYAKVIQGLMGVGIGLGVALSLKKTGIAAVTIMVAGMIGNYAFHWIDNPAQHIGAFQLGAISDPLSCYISSLCAVGALRLLKDRKTPVDLILVPLLGLAAAMLYSFFVAEWIHYVTLGISWVIEICFNAVPFLMCIIISVLVGMALTAPISSVAICVAIKIGMVPMAAAAALIGCCVQMVGIAVESARDNKWGSVLAIGIGTSMLQFKNIIRKPIIWVPTILVSAILGPFAMLFPLEGIQNAIASLPNILDTTSAEYVSITAQVSSLSVAGGMGTSGLVGPLNFLGVLGYNRVELWLLLIFVCIVGAGLLVFLVDLFFRKLGWIKKGDFSLANEN